MAAYSRDLARRLAKLGNACPKTWFVLGTSGWKMHLSVLRALAEIDPNLVQDIEISKADYLRENGSISFDPSIEGIQFGDKPVFLIDSALHSGRSMIKLIQRLRVAGVKKFVTYGLVVKSGSLMVPTYFGVVIDDRDRTYFDLDQIPNNRLHDKKPLVGVLRALNDSDANTKIDVGEPFEGLCVGDLLYDKETRSSKIYGYEEDGSLIGFVSFRKAGQSVFIDAIGTVTAAQKGGIASAMLRWAETWGRSAQCTGVQLWGYERVLDIYPYFGYTPVNDEWRTLGLGRRYKLMHKPLLYNVKVTEGGDEAYHGQGEG